MYLRWLDALPPVVSMWPKPQWTGVCVADASAHGQECGIGGAVTFPSHEVFCFSFRMHSSDFVKLNIPMHDNLQRDISSLETLAQIALVFLVTRILPGFRIPLRISTLSDNTAAEAVSNKLFSTQMPLALFLERLSILISSSNVQVDVNHIAGVSNDLADALSRWDQQGGPPCICNRDDRFPLSLGDIRSPNQTAQLYPSDAWIPWSLP